MNTVLLIMAGVGLLFFMVAIIGKSLEVDNVEALAALGAALMVLALGLFLIWIMPFIVMQWVFSILFVVEVINVLVKLNV